MGKCIAKNWDSINLGKKKENENSRQLAIKMLKYFTWKALIFLLHTIQNKKIFLSQSFPYQNLHCYSKQLFIVISSHLSQFVMKSYSYLMCFYVHIISSPQLPSHSKPMSSLFWWWCCSVTKSWLTHCDPMCLHRLMSFESVMPSTISFSVSPFSSCSQSLLLKGLSRIFSNTAVQNHQFFSAQHSLWSNTHICIWLLEKP